MTEQIIELTDTEGTKESWPDLLRTDKYTVLIFTSVQCPYALAAYEAVDRVAAKYSPSGFQFRLIDSNVSTEEDPEDLEAMRALEPRPSVRFLRDDAAKLASLLGASHTPHVFVLNGGGEKLWSGPIDNRFKKPDDWTEDSVGFWPWDDEPPPAPQITKLEDVLGQLLNGGSIANEVEHPIGCSIK